MPSEIIFPMDFPTGIGGGNQICLKLEELRMNFACIEMSGLGKSRNVKPVTLVKIHPCRESWWAEMCAARNIKNTVAHPSDKPIFKIIGLEGCALYQPSLRFSGLPGEKT